MQGRRMISSVIGGAMLPHAPQFFTMPDTEDRDTVERVKAPQPKSAPGSRRWRPISGSSFRTTMPSNSFIRRRRPSRSMSATRPRARSPAANFRWKVPSEIGFELVRQLYRQGFDPAFTSVAKIDYAIGHSAHPSRRRGPGPADLRQRLPAAAADDGALLRLWSGGGADRHGDGPENGGRGQRRHVAFPRHRALFPAGSRLGQGGPRKARRRAI